MAGTGSGKPTLYLYRTSTFRRFIKFNVFLFDMKRMKLGCQPVQHLIIGLTVRSCLFPVPNTRLFVFFIKVASWANGNLSVVPATYTMVHWSLSHITYLFVWQCMLSVFVCKLCFATLYMCIIKGPLDDQWLDTQEAALDKENLNNLFVYQSIMYGIKAGIYQDFCYYYCTLFTVLGYLKRIKTSSWYYKI